MDSCTTEKVILCVTLHMKTTQKVMSQKENIVSLVCANSFIFIGITGGPSPTTRQR